MELKEKVRPEHTALLVIDIQKDFASPDGLLGRGGRDLSMVEPLIEKLKETIRIAEEAGVLTLYTKQIYDRSKLSDLQKEQYDLDNKFVTCDVATDGPDFYKLTPSEEFVFPKYNYNAFSNPDLCRLLTERGIKTLVIAGMDTIYCVEAAIRNGFDIGYKIVVPEDLVACNARHIDWHNKTLELTRKTFGAVTTSEEVNGIWKNRRELGFVG